jgi:hypothetical protein
MWKELITQLDPSAVFAPGINETDIKHAETALGVALPPDLRELLQETDGVRGEYGPDYIWSLDTIVQQNHAMREDPTYQADCMPFDSLLFLRMPELTESSLRFPSFSSRSLPLETSMCGVQSKIVVFYSQDH